MKPSGKDGYGYEAEIGDVISGEGAGTPITVNGFYIVVTRAATGTGLPPKDDTVLDGELVGPGDLCYLTTADTLVVGDAVKPVTLTFIGWMNDDEQTGSKQVFDQSSQENAKNGVKAYAEGAFVEKTGSLTGQYDVGSESQERIERRFGVVISDDGTKVTRKPIKSGPFHLMLSRRETTESGELEVWEYKPMIPTQLTQRKPMDGTQEFNVTYTVDGNYRPAIYKRKVA